MKQMLRIVVVGLMMLFMGLVTFFYFFHFEDRERLYFGRGFYKKTYDDQGYYMGSRRLTPGAARLQLEVLTKKKKVYGTSMERALKDVKRQVVLEFRSDGVVTEAEQVVIDAYEGRRKYIELDSPVPSWFYDRLHEEQIESMALSLAERERGPFLEINTLDYRARILPQILVLYAVTLVIGSLFLYLLKEPSDKTSAASSEK